MHDIAGGGRAALVDLDHIVPFILMGSVLWRGTAARLRAWRGAMSEVSDNPVETVTARLAAIETRLDAALAEIAAVNARRLAARTRRPVPSYVSRSGGFIAGFVVAVLLLFSKLLFS
jgi:hypothetical protein